MSLLWRDRLVLAIYPDRVAWLHAVRRWPTRVTDKGVVSCAVDSGRTLAGRAIDTARNPAHGKAGGMRVTALLSNRLSRYAVVPNPDSARSREELDLLARHSFERTHGDAVAGWSIRLSDAAPGRAALAGALDRQLVVSLGEAVAAASARLTSIQPYLMAAFNRHHRMFAERDGIFILAEPERVTVLAWKTPVGAASNRFTRRMTGWASWVAFWIGWRLPQDLNEGCPLRVCAPELLDSENAGSVAGVERLENRNSLAGMALRADFKS